MPIAVPAITWTEQADSSSPIASYAYSLSAPDDISFGLNAERFGIVTRPRFVSVDNTRNTTSVTVRMYNASYTILGSQAQTVPIQTKTDRLQIIGANGTLGVTFFLSEPYAAGVNYSDILASNQGAGSTLFKATLYPGIASARSIVTGADYVTNGGLLWNTMRTSPSFSIKRIFDTERGPFIFNRLDSSGGQQIDLSTLTSFNSNGFSCGTGVLNSTSTDYVSYDFLKSPGFFDVVTYVGDGSGGNRSIAHGLGVDIGFLIVKSLSNSGVEDNYCAWNRYMDNTPNGKRIYFNTNGVVTVSGSIFPLPHTTTSFIVGNALNQAGVQYIAYIAADGPSGKSRCGFYTGNGSPTGPTTNLGARPRFVLVKQSNDFTNWVYWDEARGQGVYSVPHDPNPEVVASLIEFLPTGFRIISTNSTVNADTSRYFYWAIVE